MWWQTATSVSIFFNKPRRGDILVASTNRVIEIVEWLLIAP